MIDTTCQLLRRQGVAATGLQEVIDTSGAPRGSVYHHFPGGKAELVGAAVRRSGELGAERIVELASNASGIQEVIGWFIDEFEAALTSSQFVDGCPIATVALETAATPGPTTDAVAAAFTAWIDALATLLEASGLGRERATDIATDVLAHVEGAIVVAKALRTTRPLELSRDSIDVVLAAARDSLLTEVDDSI